MANYKYCFVVNCKSTTIKTPGKLFFRVPSDGELKPKWFKSAGRKDVPKPGRCSYYCCEDHFTLEEDMENYIKFKLVGARLKIKKGVLPHIFDCHNHQTDKKPSSRPGCGKLNRRKPVADILSACKEQPVHIETQMKTIHPTKRNDCEKVADVTGFPQIPLDPSLTVIIENGFSENITSNNEKTTYAIHQSLTDKQPFTCPLVQIKEEPTEVYYSQSPTYHHNDNTTQPMGTVKVEPKQEGSEICESSTEFRSYAYALWTPNVEPEFNTMAPMAVKQEQEEGFIVTECNKMPTENYLCNHGNKKENIVQRNESNVDKNNSSEYCLMNYRNSIVVHVKLNGSSVDEIFKCAKCECTSRHQPDLLRHIRMFHDADAAAYNCTECSYTTTWKHYLRDHYRLEHHASDQLQECPQCDYTSKLRYDFDKPINKDDLAVSAKYRRTSPKANKAKETSDKSKDTPVQKRVTANVFTCPKCDFKAKWKYELNRHLHLGCDVDTSDVYYKCTRCSYSTKNHVRLVGHLRLKHKPNPFTHKCTKCSFTCKYKKYLTKHQRIKHDPDADVYTCTDCNYSTKEKKYLSRHITRRHDTNAPIYKCASCKFTTTWRCDLVKHFRMQHNNTAETLRCAQCPYTTKFKSVMIKHLKRKHSRNKQIDN